MPDEDDNCPLVVNADQADVDRDRLGDACDSVVDPLDAGTGEVDAGEEEFDAGVEEPDAGEEPALDAGLEEPDAGVIEEPPPGTGGGTAGPSEPADETMRGGCTSAPGLVPLAAVVLALRRRRQVS